jgi:hypothetical protein
MTDQEFETILDQIGKNYPDMITLSEFMEALHTWLKRRDDLRCEGVRFEQKWIATLKKNPDDASRAEEWLEAQAWSEP